MKKLEPTVGLTGVVAIGVSAVVPGIFVLPGLAMDLTGPSVWLAYLAAALSVLPAAISKAELATAMPASGGTYIYLARAFGPLAGTISGLGLWMSILLKSAFALVGFAAYLYVVAPQVDVKVAAMGLLIGITALNIFGIGKVSKAQIFVVSVSVGGLVVLMFLTAGHMDYTRLENPFPRGMGGFLAATGFVFVSYAGVTKMAALAEEVKNPERNLPLAMFLALIIAALLYGVVTFFLVGALPADQLEGNVHPLYTLAQLVGGDTLGVVAVALAVLTMTAMATAGLLAASRFPFAMSRDRLLPDSLTHIHQSFKTPVNCIIATSLAMAVAILFLDIGPIAKLASAFKIVIFMAVNVAVIALRESRVEWYTPSYRSPLYPWVQIFGIIAEGVLLMTMGVGPAIALLVIVVLGAILFFGYGRSRTTHRGVVGKMGQRKELLQEAYSRTTQEIRRAAAPTAPNTLVALDSRVRSPETLAEVGVALSGSEAVKVLHITEVPEQVLELDAVEEEVAVTSLRRRIAAMAEIREHNIEFEAVVTHDTVATVHRAASELAPEWTVLEWAGRRNRDLFIRNPRLWLHRHMPSNLALFHDAGVRYIREIMVYPRPGPDDALVVETAGHLAKTYGASLNFVAFVSEDDNQTEVQRQADYLDQVQQLCDFDSDSTIVRGKDFVDSMAEATTGYDLLVMGAPIEQGFSSLFGTIKDKLTEQAACSVLRLQTPQEKMHQPLLRKRAQTVDFDLLAHLDEQCIRARVSPTNKNSAFSLFSEAFSESLGLSANQVLDALWTRERTQNTSVGLGVALPHATVPGLTSSCLGIFTVSTPLPYQAIDGIPVDVFVVTLGPPEDRQTHLLLLATVAKLILHTDLLEHVRAAENAEEIREAVKRVARTNPLTQVQPNLNK